LPDEGLCYYLLHVASKHNDAILANDVIHAISQQGIPLKESHFVPLIEIFASLQDFKGTFDILHTMRRIGIQPDKHSAVPIVHKLGKNITAILQARNVLVDFSDSDSFNKRLEYDLLIYAFAFNANYEEAMRTYYIAKEKGIPPTTETLNTLIDSCIFSKQPDVGVRLYNELLLEKVSPTATTLSKMVTLITLKDDFEEAFVYLEKMKDSSMVPLRGCYYRLINRLAHQNDPRLSMVLEDLEACGYTLSSKIQRVIDSASEH
ncbi:hypothetical protein BDF14DRAFT_1683719, partial [Spinellus fusiger]